MAHRKAIGHPDPRTEISLGLMMVISKDDQALERELTRAFLSYLEVGGKRRAPVPLYLKTARRRPT